VLLPEPLSQTVRLTLDPGDAELARLPESASVANALGEFSLSVEERDDGRIIVSRSLSIGEGRSGGSHGLVVPSSDWPLLRALLLEESDPRHRTLILK